jgi:hypothetical protein
MYADEAAAVMDIILQGLFFFGPKDLTGWAQEDERCVFPEDLAAEPGGVGGGVDLEAVVNAQFRDGCDTRGNAGMVITVGLTEDEDPWL